MIKKDQKSRLSEKVVDITILITSLLLIAYTFYRAATLSFIIDESLSFIRFVPLKFMDIVTYRVPSSNNHIFNSLWIKYVSTIFGSSELLLRLPSLVSHCIYIIFTYKILKKIPNPLIVLSGFLLLNFNPFMLDFFSLARGYAMALSLTVVSIYFFFNYIDSNEAKVLKWSLISAMLAVLSNFPWLIYYVSLVIIINIYWIGYQDHFNLRDLLKKNKPVLIYSFILLVIIFEPIRKLIKGHEFYDGGGTGFWIDTVGSLINSTLYDQPYQQKSSVFLKYFIAIIIPLMGMTFIYRIFKRRLNIFTDKFTLALLFLLVPCFVSLMQHYLINSLYLINRMAMFFIPLFLIAVILFVNEAKYPLLKIIGRFLLCILAIAFLIHTIMSFNISYTAKWKYDSDSKQMLQDLEKQIKMDNKSKVKLGAMWLYKPTINFYRISKKYTWLEEATTQNYRASDFDYYFLADSNMTFITTKNLTILKHYQNSNSYLAKRKTNSFE